MAEAKDLWDQYREHPLKVLAAFRIPSVFILCYIIDFAVYVFIIKSPFPNYLQGFLTSPFSPNEDYTGHYPSPQVGAIYNVGVVTFIILFADIYFRLIHPSGWRISPSTAGFFLSVAASFVLSGVWWLFTGAPSAGTSIIGSSMVLTLFVFSSRDLVSSARNKPQVGKAAMPWGPLIFSSASGVVYVAEYILSSSLVPHMVGDTIFGTLMILYFVIDHRVVEPNQELQQPSEKRGSRDNL
jgi:hypothetical protein